MSASLENSAGATGLEKISFHSIPKKGNAKECLNYRKELDTTERLHCTELNLNILWHFLTPWVLNLEPGPRDLNWHFSPREP